MINPEVAAIPAAPPPPAAAAGRKTHLTFTPFAGKNGARNADTSRSFTVMLNPAELKHRRAIAYNDERRLGGVAKTLRFSTMDTDTLDLSIVLDGTGVVPRAAPGTPTVGEQLEQLERAIYRYDGTDGEPPFVHIVWGSLFFGGRLRSMSTRFTLFEPSGKPLRAMIDLAFAGSTNPEEARAIMTAAAGTRGRVIEVREGDTLPQLCEAILGDWSRYEQVARFNGLHGFRLEPGTLLQFPPTN